MKQLDDIATKTQRPKVKLWILYYYLKKKNKMKKQTVNLSDLVPLWPKLKKGVRNG